MENNFLTEMGKRIRERRKHLRLSQEALAERADTTKQTVSLAEKGQQELRAGNIARISDVLGVSTDYLLKGTKIDTDHMMLDERIRTLNTDQYDYISDVINRFVDFCEKTTDVK
jgi:transcriptional regulator with XRE-family HTH domain